MSRVSRPRSREVLGSNPTGPVSNLGQVRYPTLPKSLGMNRVYSERMAVGVKPDEEEDILPSNRFQYGFL